MEVRAFRLVEDGAPEPVGLEMVERERGDDGAQFWIDVERPQAEPLERLLVELGVAPLMRRQVLDGRSTPVASSLVHQLLVRLPVQPAEEEREHSMLLLMVPGVVLSVHDLESETVHRFASLGIEAAGVKVETTFALLVGVLHAVVRRDLDLVDRFRAKVDALAGLVSEDPGDIGLEELIDLRRRAETLTAVLEDQLYCVSALPGIEMPALRTAELGQHLAAEQRTLKHLTHVLERATRRLEQIREQRSLATQDLTNRRLKVLTVVQAVFVPLTLVTGIYGMNFEYMPELAWRGAYFAALGLMALVAGGSLVIFWRRGWFD